MNVIFHSILFYQFVFAIGNNRSFVSELSNEPTSAERNCAVEQSQYSSLPLEYLKLSIVKDGKTSAVNLKRVKCVLANKNLPILITNGISKTTSFHGTDDNVLQLNNKVMEQLGEFTIYQQPETSSAAIYFHKRREFDGMVGYELLIQKLSVDNVNPTRETLIALGQSGVYIRPEYSGHKDSNDFQLEDPGAGVNDQKLTKTYESHVYDGYPEVLVIVSWDVTEYWTQNVKEADHDTTIVSQVLTLFNGVDMLYSKLENTKIQINIAGIIIAKGEQSLSFLQRCYYPIRSETGRIGYWMDGVCANSLLRLYLHERVNKIPLESYDVAIFLTREDLFKIITNDDDNRKQYFHHAMGVASNVEEIYKFRKSRGEVILIASVTTKEYLENYSTIAHEIAHLMSVRHDKSPSFTQDGKCCGNLLRTVSEWCDKCLSWSETSERTLNLFFSSPNSCTFINKPRSLNPPRRDLILTADEQCRCYGYKSARKFREIFKEFCKMDLECVGEDSEFHHTVIPMDGTPCHNDGVCWWRRCMNIEI